MNSQDLTKQLQTMAQEAQTLETTIQHRKNEALVVQRKLDNLHEEIDKRTSELLKNQKETLKNKAKTLNATLEELKSRIANQQTTITDNIITIDKQTITIKTNESILDTIKISNDKITSKLQANITSLETTKKEMSQLKQDKIDLELSISENEKTKLTLTTDITALETDKSTLEQAVIDLNTIYDKKTTEKEQALAILDAKVLDSTQNLNKMRQEQEIVRNDLAIWQKNLDERDRNLRIRESKVESGENKIIQNSDLLNL